MSETDTVNEAKHSESGAANLTELLVPVPVEINPGIRFLLNSGSGEWEGQKVEFFCEVGGGFQVAYKGQRYRYSPEALAGAIIDLVDGTKIGLDDFYD